MHQPVGIAIFLALLHPLSFRRRGIGVGARPFVAISPLFFVRGPNSLPSPFWCRPFSHSLSL